MAYSGYSLDTTASRISFALALFTNGFKTILPMSLRLGLSLFFFCVGANATTILGLDIDKVAMDAEFIFEGEVIHSETRQNSGTGIISTYVTFTIVDVIKGNHGGDSLELKFMGGEFNGEIVKVSGLTIPQQGEQGIYFVESLNRSLFNPLLGWSQGHFIIVDDNGERRISTLDEKPVTRIEPVSAIPPSIKKPRSFIEGKNEVAGGVVTQTSALTSEQALSVEQFKDRIRELLEN